MTQLNNRVINPQKEFERIVPDAIKKACFSVRIPLDIKMEYIEKAKQMAKNMEKYGQHYSTDHRGMEERSINGNGAQIALEYYLGIKFTNWETDKPDNVPDLQPVGLRVGVKTFKAPKNAPLIFKNIEYPEIIMAIDEHDKDLYHCLGIFSTSKLRFDEYRCDSLVHDPYILERNTKTGFYKVDVGVPFSTFDQLKKIVGPLWTI